MNTLQQLDKLISLICTIGRDTSLLNNNNNNNDNYNDEKNK